jgi:hypothetical protein
MLHGSLKYFCGALVALTALGLAPGILNATTYALVVGITEYGAQLQLTSQELLRFPESDAKALYGILLSSEGGNVEPQNIRLLLGASATTQALTGALTGWLAQTAKPEDAVFIYFSGHGHFEGGQGYLIAYDTVRTDIPHTAVPLSALRQALRGIRAATKVVFLDACHSGALNQTPGVTGQLRQSLVELDRNTISIVASTAGQNALEGGSAGDRHTLFGQFLLSGLDGSADADCNGAITAKELADYIQKQVGKASKGAQMPSVSLPPALSNLPLARYAQPRCSGASPPADKGDLRVKLSPFDCKDSPAVVQINGRTMGTICAEGVLWIPGLPRGTYKLRITRAEMQPREEAVTITPPEENLVTLQLRPKPSRGDGAERDLKKALDLYTKGGDKHYQAAAQVLGKLRAQYPADPEFAYYAGLIQKVEGSSETASSSFRTALAMDASHLGARRLLADLRITERPSDAIRFLLEVPDLTANDVLSSAILSRAYQRLHLCGESLQWARTGSERAPTKGDLQAEPLVEYAESQKACAEETQDEADQIKFDKAAVANYRLALQRLEHFRSGTGGKLWYEIGGLVGAGWKFEVARKDQYDRLLVDTYAGLCQVNGRDEGQTCEAIESCEKWTHLDKSDPEGRLRSALNAASAASTNLVCSGRRWTWPPVCDLYQSISIDRLPPELTKTAGDLGKMLRERRLCPNLK